MPESNLPSMWPFIREMFFNRKALIGFVRRNKLSLMLAISNTTLFFMLLFVTEQAINLETNSRANKEREAQFKTQTDWFKANKGKLEQCQSDLVVKQEDYRILSQEVESLVGQVNHHPPMPSIPAPAEPVIPNRDNKHNRHKDDESEGQDLINLLNQARRE